MKGRKYTVKLVRPVFQAIVVEVTADDADEAALRAVDVAESEAADGWVTIGETDDYCSHPVEVMESDDVDDKDDLLLDERHKYLLLQADTEEAEGQLLMQPWAYKQNSLLFADVAVDWKEHVNELYDQGIQSWLGDLDDGGEPSDERLIAKKLILRSLRQRE
jgi:hypothetical protein